MSILFDRRIKAAIVVVAVGIYGVLAAARGLDFSSRRREALAQAEDRAGNRARILAEYLQQVFAASDAALRQLVIERSYRRPKRPSRGLGSGAACGQGRFERHRFDFHHG